MSYSLIDRNAIIALAAINGATISNSRATRWAEKSRLVRARTAEKRSASWTRTLSLRDTPSATAIIAVCSNTMMPMNNAVNTTSQSMPNGESSNAAMSWSATAGSPDQRSRSLPTIPSSGAKSTTPSSVNTMWSASMGCQAGISRRIAARHRAGPLGNPAASSAIAVVFCHPKSVCGGPAVHAMRCTDRFVDGA